MSEPNPMKLAILIDAENVLPIHGDAIFSQAESLGTVTVKEIYGAATALGAWVEPVLKYAIHPNLTIRASKGKNTSDIALVIGAMDLLVNCDIDGVIIASSDSDFSALSVRLRTAGLQVIGMGTEKSNPLWRTACSSFIVLEQPGAKSASKSAAKASPASQPAQQPAAEKKQAQSHGNGKPAGGTHKERAAAIEQAIQKRLDASSGRLQVSTLFPMLNKLPEYRLDRQSIGKKPLNYLISTFGERFDFVTAEDGNTWVSKKGMRFEETPKAETPAEPEADAVQPEPETEPAEAQEPPVEATEVQTVEPEASDIPETASEPEAADEAADDASSEANLAMTLLVNGGMAPDVAETIVGILQSATDKRAAYNSIRRVYGSIEGRQYYNQAKEILENRGE